MSVVQNLTGVGGGELSLSTSQTFETSTFYYARLLKGQGLQLVVS